VDVSKGIKNREKIEPRLIRIKGYRYLPELRRAIQRELGEREKM